jgi:hypothetical protein
MDYSSELYDYLQPWNMDVCMSTPAMREGSQRHNFGPAKLYSTIDQHPLESTALAFHDQHEVGNPPLQSSQLPNTSSSQIPILYRFSGDKFSIHSAGSHSPLCGNQCHHMPGSELLPHDHDMLHAISKQSRHSSSSRAAISSKKRIRWTQDLHEKFVDCVNLLGGAESK